MPYDSDNIHPRQAITSILQGDVRTRLKDVPGNSVQCIVTSPPYYGHRDYGVDGQLGLESTPDEYVAEMVAVFRDCRRCLRPDGVMWLNLGDSYSATRSNNGGYSTKSTLDGFTSPATKGRQSNDSGVRRALVSGCKSKDLIGIPWMVAFALRDDGWYLRSDTIWHKANVMPESVKDRPTSAHEHVFLLSKSARYFYDADAIAEPAVSFGRQHSAITQSPKTRALQDSGHHGLGGDLGINFERKTRNARNVWTISTAPFKGAHFACMPPALAERCIKAGSKPGDIILDPFGGAGTTAVVANKLGRDALLIELNPDYVAIANSRLATPAFDFYVWT